MKAYIATNQRAHQRHVCVLQRLNEGPATLVELQAAVSARVKPTWMSSLLDTLKVLVRNGVAERDGEVYRLTTGERTRSL